MPDVILVPAAGSDESEPAVQIALALTQVWNAAIVLLWAWEGIPGLQTLVDGDVAKTITDREVNDREERLHALAARYLHPAGIDVHYRVPVGDPTEQIIRAADETEARAVVMTTHGRSGFKRWRLGSVASRVLRDVAVPTVLYRPHAEGIIPTRLRRILVPVDGSELSESALPEAAALARAAGASLRLLRAVPMVVPLTPIPVSAVYDQANDATRRSAELYLTSLCEDQTDLDVERRIVQGDATAAVLHEAEDADLIVMASHGRGGVVRVALGSVSDAVVRASPVPVMIVPPRRDQPADA